MLGSVLWQRVTFRIILHFSEWQGCFGEGRAGCWHGKAGGCPEHHPAKGGCALCSEKPKEQQPLLMLRDSLGALGSRLCCSFLSINECLLLQAQRPQKVQQSQLCEPVPVVPLPPQDRFIHLPPSASDAVWLKPSESPELASLTHQKNCSSASADSPRISHCIKRGVKARQEDVLTWGAKVGV